MYIHKKRAGQGGLYGAMVQIAEEKSKGMRWCKLLLFWLIYLKFQLFASLVLLEAKLQQPTNKNHTSKGRKQTEPTWLLTSYSKINNSIFNICHIMGVFAFIVSSSKYAFHNYKNNLSILVHCKLSD